MRIQLRDKRGRFMRNDEALKILAGAYVKIGIPESSTRTNRKGEQDEVLTNAKLAYLQEHGSPLQNIPAREFLRPVLKHTHVKDEISKGMSEAVTAAIHEDFKAAGQALINVGQLGVSAVRAWFFNPRNRWHPLARSTVRRKGHDQPLIESKQMWDSITFKAVLQGKMSGPKGPMYEGVEEE